MARNCVFGLSPPHLKNDPPAFLQMTSGFGLASATQRTRTCKRKQPFIMYLSFSVFVLFLEMLFRVEFPSIFFKKNTIIAPCVFIVITSDPICGNISSVCWFFMSKCGSSAHVWAPSGNSLLVSHQVDVCLQVVQRPHGPPLQPDRGGVVDV